ncbi:hypothetical protein [Trinickia violacea]|uniref:hypothetical protein n=1 Tax=Trinickia violacea TaxID=2571746 RepID=UPI0020C7EBD3|nr:hypothetical protein [Trinickia violacea]
MAQSIQARARSLAILLIAFSVASLGSQQTLAQSAPPTKVSFEVHAQNSKFTQQLTLDVGDVPGHTVRLFEILRTFPENPPGFAGVQVKNYWTRGESDTMGGNGLVLAYYVFNMANGEKIFGKFEDVAQAAGQSSTTRTVVGNLVFTGGTGKLRRIRGTLRVLTDVDISKGLNDTKCEGQYWMEKE